MKGLTILWYTLLRLGLFVLPLAILLVLRINFVVAVIVAAIVGLCLSYLLLAKPRHAMSADLYARIHRSTPVTGEEEDYEDAVVDSAASKAAPADPGTDAASEAALSAESAPAESAHAAPDAPAHAAPDAPAPAASASAAAGTAAPAASPDAPADSAAPAETPAAGPAATPAHAAAKSAAWQPADSEDDAEGDAEEGAVDQGRQAGQL